MAGVERRIWILGSLVCASALLLAGLPSIGPAATAQTTSSVNVTIDSFSFNPSTITVVIGVNNTVVWTNQQSGVEHTVTADDGSFSSSPLPTGQSYSHTFTTPGTYSYHCSIHPYMKGVVNVLGQGSSSSSSSSSSSTAPSSSSSTQSSSSTLTSSEASSAQTTTHQSQSSSSSTPSSSGSIPEFPPGMIVVAVTALVLVSYLLTRRASSRRGLRHLKTAV